MDPQTVFCPNRACSVSGRVGRGNIGIHSYQRRRFSCHVCHRPFSARQGTPFYRRRTDAATISLVTTLVAHRCPIPAIHAAFGFQRRTVLAWVDAAGAHCQRLHEHLVLQPRALGRSKRANHVSRRSAASCGWPWP